MNELPVTLQLTLTVRYIPHGTSTEDLISYLERLPEHAAGEGLLTGESDAEVLVHDYSAIQVS